MPINFDRTIALQLDDRLYEGLRVDFQIVKNLSGSPLNKASITIYNVSDDTYNQIAERRRDLAVQVFAGYGGAPARLFIGNPVKNGVEFNWPAGGDKILKLECQDGYKSYQKTRLSLSLDVDGIRLSDIVAEVAKKMQLPVGVIDFPDDLELTQGLVLSGSPKAVLDRVTASSGAQWSIQDGALQILPRRKVRRSSGPLFSSELKNIHAYPTLTDDGISIKSFLTPGILPGDRFKIEVGDKRFDGIWKATTVKHTGSVWGDQFSTELEGRRWTGETARKKSEIESSGSGYDYLLDPSNTFSPETVEESQTWWETD